MSTIFPEKNTPAFYQCFNMHDYKFRCRDSQAADVTLRQKKILICLSTRVKKATTEKSYSYSPQKANGLFMLEVPDTYYIDYIGLHHFQMKTLILCMYDYL